MVEVLDDFIAVKFYSSLARDGTVKMHRHYHYTQDGKLIKALGNADEITFEEARILLKKLISNSHTNGVAAPKNTLASVFKLALFNLSSHKGAVSYDEHNEKQVYNPFPNFREEI